MLNHTWGPSTTVKEPTCIEDGVGRRTCSVCGTTENFTKYALGHNFEKIGTSGDYNVYRCKRCLYSFTGLMNI